MMRAASAAPAMLLALLAGCGAQVTLQGHTVSEGRPGPAKLANARDMAAAVVRSVSITFTPTVRQQLPGEAGFDADALHETIERELAARALLDAQGSGPELEVLVDALEVKPTGSRLVVAARVRLLGAESVEQRSYNVRAEAPAIMPGAARGADELRAIYRRFAVLLAEGLAGATG
jgi:hypothetical protein